MTELLVQPLREGNESVADASPSRFHARSALSRPIPPEKIDALIAATAVHASATGLITNDAALSRVEGLDVLVRETLL